MNQSDRTKEPSELAVEDGGGLILSSHPASLPGRTPEQAVALYYRLGARALLTLLNHHELEKLGLSHLPDLCAPYGMAWFHAPIDDYQAPDAEFEVWWSQHSGGLHRLINDGAALAIHCFGGLGRTGTIAARLLVERGLSPEAAIAAVRQCRPGAIETSAQVLYLLQRTPLLRN